MRRISTPTAAQDLFGPGKHGFRNGDPANAILATRLQAEWFNALQEELANAVEQAGEVLDENVNSQLSAVIEGVVDRKSPVASQAEAVAGENNAKRMTPLRVKQAMEAFGGVLPFGYFSGFTLANSVAAPNTAISVSAGAARSADNAHSIVLTGTLSGTLQSAGAWAAGDNQNKLDAGARANGTWYHVFVIRRASDGAADILFSLSATAPTMPAGYAGFRRLGSVRTDASGNILGFTNAGRQFFWKTPPLDVNVTGSIVDASYVLSVPAGVRVLARLGGHVTAGEAYWSYRSTDANAIAPSIADYVGGVGSATASSPDYSAAEVVVLTNTQAQAHFRTGWSAAPFRVVTYGWTEI